MTVSPPTGDDPTLLGDLNEDIDKIPNDKHQYMSISGLQAVSQWISSKSKTECTHLGN